MARHRAEPVPPLATPVTLTDGRFGRVPKASILTTQDRTISPALQRAMAEASGVSKVVELTSSHTPMLSAPTALAVALAGLAQEP